MNIVLSKLNGKTGELNKSTNVFTEREWTTEEHERYVIYRGQEQINLDQEKVK